jgi:hypothetical protein
MEWRRDRVKIQSGSNDFPIPDHEKILVAENMQDRFESPPNCREQKSISNTAGRVVEGTKMPLLHSGN